MNKNAWAILLWAICCHFAACAQGISTLIEAEPEFHHFGTIPDSAPVQCTFRLTNRAGRAAKIAGVHTSCSCMVSKMKSDELLPGVPSELDIVFDPRGREGHVTWEIRISVDSDPNPVRVLFDADILQDGCLSHHSISFGEFLFGEAQTREIWISPRELPDFRILSARLRISENGSHFRMKIEREQYSGFYPAPREACRIRVQSSKNLPPGRIAGELILETDIPEREHLQIPISGKVRSNAIVSNREYLAMGVLKSGQVAKKRFLVYHIQEGKRFGIEKITSDLPFFETSLETVMEGRYYEVEATAKIEEGTPAGEFRGKLVIHSQSEGVPRETTVRVQGFVLPRIP